MNEFRACQKKKSKKTTNTRANACLLAKAFAHTVHQCARSCSPLGNIHKDNSAAAAVALIPQHRDGCHSLKSKTKIYKLKRKSDQRCTKDPVQTKEITQKKVTALETVGGSLPSS